MGIGEYCRLIISIMSEAASVRAKSDSFTISVDAYFSFVVYLLDQ